MKVIVETSARHVHLSAADCEALFGQGYELTIRKELSQPGQYVCNERVDLVGAKNTIKNVSILGPLRKETQVEISLTDARTLGVEAQVRESGCLDGTAGVTLVGPNGSVTVGYGLIAAKRHIHFSPEDAAAIGVADKDIVSVKLEGSRPLIFGDVVARVSPSFATAMHIDTDESNAAGLSGVVYGEIIKL